MVECELPEQLLGNQKRHHKIQEQEAEEHEWLLQQSTQLQHHINRVHDEIRQQVAPQSQPEEINEHKNYLDIPCQQQKLELKQRSITNFENQEAAKHLSEGRKHFISDKRVRATNNI